MWLGVSDFQPGLLADGMAVGDVGAAGGLGTCRNLHFGFSGWAGLVASIAS